MQFFIRNTPWKADRRSHVLAGLLLLVQAGLSGCTGEEAPDQELSGCTGQLLGRLYGGIEAELNWRKDALECAGMPRPDDEGARLRFSGSIGDGEQRRHLLFILALPTLRRGETGAELPATITVIEEDAGRFFSNGENPVCWADIDSQQLVLEPDGYAVSGIAYCVAPLAELNGSSSVSFADLRFAGQLSWARPE